MTGWSRGLAAGVLVAAMSVSWVKAEVPDRSDHKGIKIVPALGPVLIDGKLGEKEWDQSGRIHVYASNNKRHEYSADFSAMWDRDFLYIGINWRDKTPMENKVDARGATFDGWQSDAVQLRFVTTGQGVGEGLNGYGAIHMDAFYSSASDFSSACISRNAPMSADSSIFKGEGKSIADATTGFAMAFERGQKGYVQEMRIPWSELYSTVPDIKAGIRMRLIGEFYWGKPEAIKWPMFFHQDPMSRPDRTNTYKSPQNWGFATLVAENNLKTDEPCVADYDKDYAVVSRKLQGVYPLSFEIPASARNFTIAIDDANGVRVRNLLGNEQVDEYVVEDRGETKVIEVLWDGRHSASWNYGWEEFVGSGENMRIAAPGTYTARCLVHDGIRLYHEGSFYNPGNPPWPSADGSGGWLGDHHPPNWVSTLPADGVSRTGDVFLSSPGGECGVPFIGVGRDGEKIWSWLRSTAKVFCHAAGRQHVFFGFQYAKRIYWGKVDPDTGKQVKFSDGELDRTLPDNPAARFMGMSVRGDTLAIAIGEGGLVFYNTDTAAQLRHFPDCKNVAQIGYTPDGNALMGLRDGKVVTVSVADGAIAEAGLPGVGSAAALTLDSAGNVYVSDASTQTVKVFAGRGGAAGTPVRYEQIAEVGEPGGHQNGPFNTLRMNRPLSLAVEERGDPSTGLRAGSVKRLWCVEDGQWFRRVSVWDVSDPAKVAFFRHYVGNAGYQGSGGSISDDDPTLGLYRGVMFKVDYKNYTYEPIELMGVGDAGERGFGNGYHFFSDVSGALHEYYCADSTLYVRARDGKWKGCPKGASGGQWGFRTYKDLNWYSGQVKASPAGFDEDGAPTGYTTEPLPGVLGQSSGSPRNGITKTRFGYIRQETHAGPNPMRVTWGFVNMVGYDNAGAYRWAYPMFWWGVHGCATAPMARPGQIIGYVKDTGKVEVGDHTFFGVRGYKGQDFIMRDDGMYVGELFRDFRECDTMLPDDKKIHGRDITDTTLSEECYSGMMARQSDGKIRVTYGHTDVRVARVEGLETARELAPKPIVIDEGHVAQFEAFQPSKDVKVTSYKIVKGGAFDAARETFDQGALELRAVTREADVPRVKLRYDGKNLYLACKVKDATPWEHKEAAIETLFKTGDAVGFLHDLGTPHGTRIVLAAPAGEKKAVVHRPRGPGNKPFAYTSPVRTVNFAYVAGEPAIAFDVARAADGYTLTAAIPWSVLGAVPASGLTFKGDLEVVFGGESQSHVKALLRWMDPVDSLHDLPTESEIWPRNFGTFTLE